MQAEPRKSWWGPDRPRLGVLQSRGVDSSQGSGSHPWLVSSLQSLSIKTSSLAEAENMADLVDGYCRLQGEHKGSLIIRAKKGVFPLEGDLAQQAVGGMPEPSLRGGAGEAKPLADV